MKNMRKLIIIGFFVLFFIKKDIVVTSGITALNIWCQNLFPILFPTFIINDLILSSGIINDISRHLGKIIKRLFRVSEYSAYVLLLSFLSGTPTNAINLYTLYKKGLVNEDDIVKTLSMTIFFNPLLIITLAGKRVLFIIWISNLLVGLIMRKSLCPSNIPFKEIDIDFKLSKSIDKNIDLLLMILGTITIFTILANLIPVHNHFLRIIITGILEVTNGLTVIKTISSTFIHDMLAIIFISFGGISIHSQIKSILKDTKINYNYFYLSRLLCASIGIIILCWCT